MKFAKTVGANYAIATVNGTAALLCAQLEQLQIFLEKKRTLASKYKEFFASQNIRFIGEPQNARSNYWLNAIILKDRCERDEFLTFSNENGVMTRPIWMLMNTLDMFKTCQCGDLSNSLYLEEKIVNIPSSVRL